MAAVTASSASTAGEIGASPSGASGPEAADTSTAPSKQGLLQALASMMADKDIKVRTHCITQGLGLRIGYTMIRSRRRYDAL